MTKVRAQFSQHHIAYQMDVGSWGINAIARNIDGIAASASSLPDWGEFLGARPPQFLFI